MDLPNLRWWGWGTLDQTYSLENQPHFWPTLRARLDLPDAPEPRPAVPLEQIKLPPSRLDHPVVASLQRLLGEEAVRTDAQVRVEHAVGKAYRDLVRLRAGKVTHPPDAVVYPADEGQVAATLAWAADRDIAVIPFGGGSSVHGGLEPEPGDRPTVTMDLARLAQVIAVDRTSRTARIQAGARGPALESALNAQGFTLGHFPRSFEFSTLGGWIATRSAGQACSGYGTIKELTEAVRLVSPTGIMETRNAPASTAGPDLLHVLLGSEGALGVITEATMRIRACPAVQDYRGLLFHSLEDGLAALQELNHHGPRPTVVCLSDAAETAGCALLSRERRGLRGLTGRVADLYLTWRKHSLTNGSCLMILGFDGEPQAVERRWQQALAVCQDHGGLSLGQAIGESWKLERFSHPYLRDTLLEAGVMVDAIKTSASWSNLLSLHREMTTAIRAAIPATGGGPGYVMTRVCHVHEWGASLSTTFLGRQVPGREVEQWWEVVRAAMEAVEANGGTAATYHGISQDQSPWPARQVGPLATRIQRQVKQALDPLSIMNPGVTAHL
jgi:alkyldihydroxyacetonephosphate synthase